MTVRLVVSVSDELRVVVQRRPIFLSFLALWNIRRPLSLPSIEEGAVRTHQSPSNGVRGGQRRWTCIFSLENVGSLQLGFSVTIIPWIVGTTDDSIQSNEAWDSRCLCEWSTSTSVSAQSQSCLSSNIEHVSNLQSFIRICRSFSTTRIQSATRRLSLQHSTAGTIPSTSAHDGSKILEICMHFYS